VGCVGARFCDLGRKSSKLIIRVLWLVMAHQGAVTPRETSALHSRAAARHRRPSQPPPQDHLTKAARHHGCVTISPCGATNQHVVKAIACFRETLITEVVLVDLSKSRAIDARFFGLLLMFRKKLKGQGAQLRLVGASPSISGSMHLGFYFHSHRM